MMNMVLKRHPLAVHFVRRQMIAPSRPAANPRPRSGSQSRDDEEEEDCSSHQSIDLPDDFVPRPKSSCEEYGTSYEQSMPMEHFTKL